jgi:hypothetical protein
MPPTASPTAEPRIPTVGLDTAPVRSSPPRFSNRRRAQHAAPWIVSPLWAAVALLVLVGILAVTGLGSTHIGFGTPRSVINTTRAPIHAAATTIKPFVGPPIELATADIASPAHAACVCSSPYVGAVTGPPVVENAALANLVRSVWRSGASFGDGNYSGPPLTPSTTWEKPARIVGNSGSRRISIR